MDTGNEPLHIYFWFSLSRSTAMNSTLRKQCIFCCCENICRTLIRNRSPKGQFKRKKQRKYCLNFSLIRLFRRLSHSLHLQHCNFHSPYLALVLQCSTLNWWRICLQTIQSETKAKQRSTDVMQSEINFCLLRKNNSNSFSSCFWWVYSR